MTRLTVGDPLPWLKCRASNNDSFQLQSIAGRMVVLFLFGSASSNKTAYALKDFHSRRTWDDKNIAMFGVTIDPEDVNQKRIQQRLPGIRYFYDFDCRISHHCGALAKGQTELKNYKPFSLLLDARLRVLDVIEFDDPKNHVNQVIAKIKQYEYFPEPTMAAVQAPILIVPRVFDLDFCRTLIAIYDNNDARDSGYMVDVNGMTKEVINHKFKSRSDVVIQDKELRKYIKDCIDRRLAPEIKKAYQFDATCLERYLVARYDAKSKGFFNRHRDNTTKATAHRRFAVSINLNAEDYEGGNLCFPEFGSQMYRPPTGGACVFSCSLLHEATRVTKGNRYVFLPFLHNDEASKIRKENSKYLVDGEPTQKRAN